MNIQKIISLNSSRYNFDKNKQKLKKLTPFYCLVSTEKKFVQQKSLALMEKDLL